MGKASRRKRSERPEREPWAEPPRWSARFLQASAAAGALLSALSTWVHYKVRSSGGAYTSFCNLSASVNCDDVVTSRYGYLFGVPVSVWAIAFYALVFAVATRASAATAKLRDPARADALGLSAAGALFSLYLAIVSFAVLETVCVLCVGLYAVAGLSLFGAWTLARPVGRAAELLRQRWAAVRRRPVLATAGLAALVGVLLLPAWLGAPTRMTRAEVFQSNPAFYDWYTSLPVVEVNVQGGVAQGSEEARVTLVEFSDFECPHCSRAHVTLKDLLPRYGDDVRFVFHHFPVSRDCNPAVSVAGHEQACEAAIASECAAEQGKFGPYANLLFAHQDSLAPGELEEYAEKARLDVGRWQRCLEEPAAAERVRRDAEEGRRLGVRNTPTFFINGRKVEGNMPFESWMMALAVELDRS